MIVGTFATGHAQRVLKIVSTLPIGSFATEDKEKKG